MRFEVSVVRLRFLFVRVATATLIIGPAAPVNLPFDMQALANAPLAHAMMNALSAAPKGPSAGRGDAHIANAGARHGEASLLKIGTDGDLPCDSGEWATSSLFGPHAGLAAALGVKASGTENGVRDAALAKALGDSRGADAADLGAIGPDSGYTQLAFGGPGDGLFLSGGTGGPGPLIVGDGGGSGTTTGPGTGPGGGTGPDTAPGPGTGTGVGGGGGDGDDGAGSIVGGGGGPNPGGGPGDDIFVGGGTGSTGRGGGTGPTGVAPGLTGPTDPVPDNHAGIGITDGNASAAVPEPASWATMLAGFLLIGGAMRSRRRAFV